MSGIYTNFVSQLLFPLHERLKRHRTVAAKRQLEQSQWWSREELERYQLRELNRLLRHCREHVPYYRDLLRDRGIEVEGIKQLADLQQLPFLTKDVIRANIDGLKADNAVGLARFNTGGSSGEPLIFYIGRQRVSHDVAAKWRATRWWGVDIGDREIVVWGSPIELGGQDRIKAWRDKLLRTRLLPAFEMSESNLDGFVRQIREFRPRMLFGYPSSLALIARHARKRGISMRDVGIKVAFVTSERLYDDQKRDISEVFGCPVANGYGGRDAGFIAHQCPEGGMHVTAEDIIVELVDRDGRRVAKGQPGEVVVTHLRTDDFPFIRYRTGDVAVFDDKLCSCGRGLPLLKEIQGRTTDFIVAQDGTIMHGLALIYVLRDLKGIESFKILQESLDKTTVMITCNESWDKASEQIIQREFKKRLGADVDIVVEFHDTIPNEKSGKFRYVVSRVA